MEAEARGYWDSAGSSDSRKTRTVTAAIEAFLADAASATGRELRLPTLSKYRTLLRRLNAFCAKCSIARLEDLTPESLRNFRETWPTGPRATVNNISRLRAFFKFAIENEWIVRNSALALRGPKHGKDVQKLPFSDQEMTAIAAAAETVPLQCGSNQDLLTLILVMRHTGLRISDAGMLKADRIEGDQLKLHTQKSGSWVCIPLAPWLLERLRTVEVKPGGYLFVTGSARLETVTDLWRRKIARVFAAAGVPHGHPHRFRHTFAVDLLSKGVDIKTVSLLLGHSSVTITERFYSAWIQSRQQALSDQIRKTWPEDLAA
jgi:site-specific recombinase XerD